MTLAGRLTLFFAGIAVATSGAIGGLSYAATDHSLDTQIRTGLMDAAASLSLGQIPEDLALPAAAEPEPDGDTDNAAASSAEAGSSTRTGILAVRPTGASTTTATPTTAPFDTAHQGSPHGPPRATLLAQLLTETGSRKAVGGRPLSLPVEAVDRAVAQSPTDHDLLFRIVHVGDVRYLMLTRSRGHGDGAVQVARSLTDRDDVLARLAGSIVAIALGVALAAALAGWFVARALTRRLVRLTGAAEQVSATGRLDVDVPGHGRDEVGRLGAAFDAMLDRLARSKDDQQRLVQNAGHELRTPLTSIRTNVSLLRRADELSPEERSAILDDLTGETRELTELVNELVELATDRRASEPETIVDLGEIADRVADRGRRRSGREVTVTRPEEPLLVRGRAQGLERAVTNLVDNALKFDGAGTEPVEIVLTGRRVAVRDRGPGVPAEDLDRIFDRFHRATSVRSLPGSGLGLSIVAEVAAEHGGSTFATQRDGGGAVIGFTLSAERLQPGSNPG